MKVLIAVALLVLLVTVVKGQQNRKKFGGNTGGGGGTNPKSNPDYDPPPEEYDQDALYYEDYDDTGAKKDKDAKAGAGAPEAPKAIIKPVKPSPKPITPARPAPKDTHHDDQKGNGSPSSLFAPRRNRTPFQPRPADKPKPTLPSFIRHPVNPAQITTPTPRPPNRESGLERAPLATPKAAVIRATTSRPSRYKAGSTSRDRTTSAPTESDNNSNVNGRKYGGAASSVRTGGLKPPRGGFRGTPT